MNSFRFVVLVVLVFATSCQNPSSDDSPEVPAIQAGFSSVQSLQVEKGLIVSGVVFAGSGETQRTYELQLDASGNWTAVLNESRSATDIQVQLFSGPNHTGLRLFQGSKTLDANVVGTQRVDVENVSYRDEVFSGKIVTTTRVEIVQIDPSNTATFLYSVDVFLKFVITGQDYLAYQVETRQDTQASETTLVHAGTIDRQGLVYTLQKVKQYNGGQETEVVAPLTLVMELDEAGKALTLQGAPSPEFHRQE